MHNILSSFKAHNHNHNQSHPSHTLNQHQASRASTTPPLLVVELFQSQGCSSCPPANDNLLKLVHDPNLLVLTYDVTYWDHLGWKYTFGNTDFDRRQWAYARALQRKNVFTPQVFHSTKIHEIARELRSITGHRQWTNLWRRINIKRPAVTDTRGRVP